ncbi:hypothetical protein BBP40_011965 [Aspergillus hancockii]|nr:hypothetical protein BBP40_011965 [Aspergillus hancockii]
MSPHVSSADALLLPDAINQVQKYVVAAFAAITWYSSVELVVLCLSTFKRYRGCYFWSLLIASASLTPHALGFIFFIFPLGVSPYIAVTLIILSWYCMVTGHSLILWSRLHLVLHMPKVLFAILILIIIDAILFHVPTTVLLYGSLASNPSHPNQFARGYNVMERVQLIGFCLQELLLSGIYLWETAKMLYVYPDQPHRRILTQLLAISVIILILDVAVVGIEYAGFYALQVMFKPVAYSTKFKLEYAILGRLVQIAQGPSSDPEPLCSSSQGAPTFTSGGHSGSGSNDVGGIDIQGNNSDAFSTGFASPHRPHALP